MRPYALGLRPRENGSFGLVRQGPLLGQTFDQILGVPPYAGDLMRLAAHGITSYLGFHIAVGESGFLSAIGWIVGILQGMGALIDVLALATDIQEAAQRARMQVPFEPFEA